MHIRARCSGSPRCLVHATESAIGDTILPFKLAMSIVYIHDLIKRETIETCINKLQASSRTAQLPQSLKTSFGSSRRHYSLIRI
jgi:hypothetical protein